MVKATKKILIAGDSFAALWPNASIGWVNILAEQYSVTNIAQAGVSEYKIFKQIESTNVDDFDLVIISHTSPSRIFAKQHPLHKTGFHKDCDLIYTDIKDRFSIPGSALHTAKKWFEHFYDDEYQIDVYKILREKILSLITIPYISISHIEIANKLSIEPLHLDFSSLWINNRGDVNHYNEFGNKFVFDKINQQIGKII